MTSPRMRLLCSYYHWMSVPDVMRALVELGCDVILDSGAFSAHTFGKAIRVEEYADFLDAHGEHFSATFTLDKIGDPDGSRVNHEYLRRRGHNPIPVWQGHDAAFPGLDAFLDGEPYVSLGGLVKTSGTHRPQGYNERRISGFLGAVAGRADVHLLGYSILPRVRAFQPASCDSSTYANPGRFGADVHLYHPRSGSRLATLRWNVGPRSTADLDALRIVAPRMSPRAWARRHDGRSDWPKRSVAMITMRNLYDAFERRYGTKIYMALTPPNVVGVVTGLYLSGDVSLAEIDRLNLTPYLKAP